MIVWPICLLILAVGTLAFMTCYQLSYRDLRILRGASFSMNGVMEGPRNWNYDGQDYSSGNVPIFGGNVSIFGGNSSVNVSVFGGNVSIFGGHVSIIGGSGGNVSIFGGSVSIVGGSGSIFGGSVPSRASDTIHGMEGPRNWTYDGQDHSSGNVPMLAGNVSISSGNDSIIGGGDVSMLGGNISIFGLFNSGTNLLQSLFFNGNKALSVCPDSSHSRWRGEVSCKHSQPWKHAHPSVVSAWLDSKSVADQQLCVYIVRNPFSILDATHRHSYDLRDCFQKKNWLSAPCRCNELLCAVGRKGRPPGCGPDHKFCAERQKEFESVVDIWNVFVSGYVRRAANAGRHRVALVRYEDLVITPIETLTKITAVLGVRLEKSTVLSVLHAKANQLGGNSDDAIEKIRRRSYLQAYSKTMIRFACAKLDRSLTKRFDYEKDCG